MANLLACYHVPLHHHAFQQHLGLVEEYRYKV